MKYNTHNIDATDKKIINLLQQDSSLSNNDMANQINLSPSACLNRTNKLKKLNIIKQCTAIIDEKKVGLNIETFVFINLHPHNRKIVNSFLKKINKIPEILECSNITGNWDYLLKIIAKDISTYRDFVIDVLLELPGVAKIETLINLKSEKKSFILPL